MQPSAPLEIKKALDSLGVRAKKGLSQHFLADCGVLQKQVELAGLKKTDTVLEIGPGLGTLTERLLARAGKVVAVEADAALAGYLEDRFSGDINAGRLEIVRGDALKVRLPKFTKTVSNLPYKISSDITFRLLEEKFECAILMYQQEFAERMCAPAGSDAYSRLSVNVFFRAECEILMKVPRSAFYPVPDVDSAIVRLCPRQKPPFAVRDERAFFSVVGGLFSHRRKKIANGLELWAAGKKAKKRMGEAAKRGEIPHGGMRVEQLSPQEIGEIADWAAQNNFFL